VRNVIASPEAKQGINPDKRKEAKVRVGLLGHDANPVEDKIVVQLAFAQIRGMLPILTVSPHKTRAGPIQWTTANAPGKTIS